MFIILAWQLQYTDKFGKDEGEMVHDGFFSAAWFPFLPGSTWAGVLVWFLVMVGLIGLFVSLFKQ